MKILVESSQKKKKKKKTKISKKNYGNVESNSKKWLNKKQHIYTSFSFSKKNVCAVKFVSKLFFYIYIYILKFVIRNI